MVVVSGCTPCVDQMRELEKWWWPVSLALAKLSQGGLAEDELEIVETGGVNDTCSLLIGLHLQ